MAAKSGAQGQRAPTKKSWYRHSVGPELGEVWERHVPRRSFDKATWASGERFKDAGP